MLLRQDVLWCAPAVDGPPHIQPDNQPVPIALPSFPPLPTLFNNCLPPCGIPSCSSSSSSSTPRTIKKKKIKRNRDFWLALPIFSFFFFLFFCYLFFIFSLIYFLTFSPLAQVAQCTRSNSAERQICNQITAQLPPLSARLCVMILQTACNVPSVHLVPVPVTVRHRGAIVLSLFFTYKLRARFPVPSSNPSPNVPSSSSPPLSSSVLSYPVYSCPICVPFCKHSAISPVPVVNPKISVLACSFFSCTLRLLSRRPF